MKSSTIVAAILLSACSQGDVVPTATQTVARYHVAFDARRYDALYALASPAVRDKTTPADAARAAAILRDRLGKVVASRRTGWRVGYGMFGPTITMQYDTRFARGAALETFVLDTGTNPPTIQGYTLDPAG